MNTINNTFIAHTFQTPGLQPYRFNCFNCLPQPGLGRHILSLISSSSLNESVQLNLPVPTSTNEEGFVVVGSCNGLLCIANEPDELFLVNPALRQVKDIKKYTIKAEGVTDHISLGFGFDNARSDYKVVRVVTDLLRFPSLSRVEVYSLYEKSWKEIETESRFKIIQPFSDANVKGIPYWVAEDNSVPRQLILVYFDVHSEKFQKISLPDNILGRGIKFGMLEYKESVSIITFKFYLNVEIWTLDDSCGGSCWIKKLNFKASPVIHGLVGCLKTGELLAQTYLNELLLYDPGKPVSKRTKFPTRILRAYNHIESLVSLN